MSTNDSPMGDRTNITDARQHDAEQAAGVIEQAMRNEGLIDKDVRLMGEIIAEALDAAGFDVVLRADPDTSDELAAEARRLLDAATPGPWKKDRGTWDAANDTTDVRVWPKKLTGLSADEIAVVSTSWIGASGADRKRARANAALIAAAPRLIAALLAERDADVSAGAVARTVAMSHIAAERDAERVARERAEAEARQLREAIEDRLRQVLAVHGQFLGDWDEWTSLGALEGYNGLTVTARTALAHLHGRHDDSPLPTMHCVLCETFRVPAVAEGAEDR